MANKIRKQTLSLGSYLESVKEEDVRSDQDVQRMAEQWDAGMMNELIVTVLTDDYIPPVILGEENLEEACQLWIIDGIQRSSSLLKFRYGFYRITSALENSIIRYQIKKLNADGSVCHDCEDNIVWETAEFDIKGKTYDELPKELKKKFNDYQVETVVHQNCTMETISKLVRRYNNHKAMNASQRAFTYVDRFARKIRVITAHDFFRDCEGFTEKERKNGVYERIVCEAVMTMFHLAKWQKQGRRMGMYLNDNASDEEFDILYEEIGRLKRAGCDRYKTIFTSRDAFIWFALYHRFLELGLEDKKFVGFLNAFQTKLHGQPFEEYGGCSFDNIAAGKATKDKRTVHQKLAMLEFLMMGYLRGRVRGKSRQSA